MSQTRVIRTDEHGPYVLTGGYTFRHPSTALALLKRMGPVDQLDRDAQAQAHQLLGALRDRGLIVQAQSTTALSPGQRVPARHLGGTTTAMVGGEIWVSTELDPRYRLGVPVQPGADAS